MAMEELYGYGGTLWLWRNFMPLCLLFAVRKGTRPGGRAFGVVHGQETCFTIRWSCDMVLPGVAWDVFRSCS
jgi:hypothetical protein